MKALDLYNQTKIVMAERTSVKAYDQFAIANINRVIVELFEQNNSKRMFRGKHPFRHIPFVETLDDDIEYEDEYAYVVMPLGVAAKFCVDNIQAYDLFNTEYQNEQIKNNCVVGDRQCHC